MENGEIKICKIYRETKIKQVINKIESEIPVRNFMMDYPGKVLKQNRYSSIKGGKHRTESENFHLVGQRADLLEGDIVAIDSKEYRIATIQKGKQMFCELIL